MVVIHLLLKHRLKQHHPRDTEVENEKEKFPVCHTLSSTSLPARMSQQLWQWKSVVPLYSEILSLINFMHGSYRPLCEKKWWLSWRKTLHYSSLSSRPSKTELEGYFRILGITLHKRISCLSDWIDTKSFNFYLIVHLPIFQNIILIPWVFFYNKWYQNIFSAPPFGNNAII